MRRPSKKWTDQVCALTWPDLSPGDPRSTIRPVKTYPFDELNAAALAEVADVRRERSQSEVWDELARGEISEPDRAALKLIVAKLFYFNTHLANEAGALEREPLRARRSTAGAGTCPARAR